MAIYEKWLGAGLGWVVTGNPLGGLLGFIAGSVAEKQSTANDSTKTITDFEVNLLVLSSYLIKIDGKVSQQEITFVNRFMNTHFDEKFSNKRAEILSHCLQKEYDLNIVCEQLRMYTKQTTRLQVVHFLFDLAISDGELSERENYFIFKVSGYLNINDIDFRRIKSGLSPTTFIETGSAYQILGVTKQADIAEIRTAYRKLVLQYHPDRNNHLSEAEKKKLALKLQQVKEAYEKIKQERKAN
jgi:DnaJ like chaperone protein